MQRVTPGTHMDYVYEMARTLREERGLNLQLLIEKPSALNPKPSWVLMQRWSLASVRVLENLTIIIRARLRGTTVFYIHYSFLSVITAGLITKILGGRVLYWNAGMPWLYKRSWAEETYQKFAYKLIDTLVTGAEALRPGYGKAYGIKPEHITVIPNWIDLNDCYPDEKVKQEVKALYNIPAEAPVLLFVQKHATRKGAQFVPEILDLITNKNTHLIMAGNGPLYDSIKGEFAKRNLSDRAHMIGSVPRVIISKLYQTADVYLLPSEEEGSPHALIEALAYGVPSVVSDVGGVRETMTEELSAWVVQYGATVAFAQKVSELLRDQNLRREVSLQAKVVAKNYEKSIVVNMFQKLFS